MEITDDDLYKTYNAITKVKQETYEKIYKKCISNIKSEAKKGNLVLFYEIQRFHPNLVEINISVCSNYIMNKLVRANTNFKTMFLEPNIIFVSWDPNHIMYKSLYEAQQLSDHSEDDSDEND